MSLWSTDDELFALAERELFTCVLGDEMDMLGLVHQFLPAQICPLNPEISVIGRAMPVLCGDVFEEILSNSANPIMQSIWAHARSS